MKSKIIIAMFSGLLAGSMAVSAQGNPPVTATAAESSATNATGAATSAATQPAVAADTTASATGAATTAADTAVASNAVPVIPLIVMDEVPLTDAVKNLARQANINYMLDPRIAYGQPGPDGKIVPQPTVSIRWENITAEQALTALLANHGLQLVDDPKTHIARVTIKDPAAPDPLLTKIIQLKFASPSNILAAAQTALTDKRSKIMGDTRTSQLVVLATEKELDALDKTVERLDLPTKQVLIEAKLLETSFNPQTIKGIDWSGTLENQHVQAGNNLQTCRLRQRPLAITKSWRLPSPSCCSIQPRDSTPRPRFLMRMVSV
jgi:type II secretory pathway component GspD/PulD (secretin)